MYHLQVKFLLKKPNKENLLKIKYLLKPTVYGPKEILNEREKERDRERERKKER